MNHVHHWKFVLISLLLLRGLTAAGEELILRIPKLTAPPKIDGTLAPDEWGGAAAVSTFRGAISRTAYPDSLRMTWYLGYDDENLYLAMDARLPSSISLKAETRRQDDEQGVIDDDHLEIQLTPHTRTQAKSEGFGFYKIMANPRGVFSDVWNHCGAPGNESLWSANADLKTATTKDSWTFEMRWPLATVKVTEADRTELILHISRAVAGVSWYFASLAPGGWESWNEFYRVILDPTAPAIQVLQTGDIVHGHLATVVRVAGDKAGVVEADCAVVDGAGKQLFAEHKPLAYRPGQPAEATFQAALPITDEGNRLDLNFTAAGKTLFNAALPFVKYTPAYEQAFLKPWLEGRPQLGDYKARILYIPSRGTLRATVDLDVFGELPAKLAAATRATATVKQADGQVIKSQTFPIQQLVSTGLLELGKLPEGAYTCAITLEDANGKAIDTKSMAFTEKHYPWENNTLGEEPVVIPPFTPLQKQGNTLTTCLNEFTFDKGGLAGAIKADGKPLLAAPMRFEVTRDGQAAPWTGGSLAIEQIPGKTVPADFAQYQWRASSPKLDFATLPATDGYQARITGKSQTGGVSVSVDTVMDYDGYQRTRVTYGPADGKSAAIDSLDLVIELEAWADLMIAGRDIMAGYQAVPILAGEGVVWKSSEMAYRPPGFKGTWLPFAYLGNGGHGLWYLGESDRGWNLDDAQPCVFIERHAGKPSLRLRLVNHPTTLTGPATAELAFLVTRSAPPPKNYRHRLWQSGLEARDKFFWFSTGWRVYGIGGICFSLPTDADFKVFGDWLRAPERTPAEQQHYWSKALAEHKAAVGEPAWFDDTAFVIYSSHGVISPALPELATYAGEWAGKNNLVAERDYYYDKNCVLHKRTDLTGRFVYDTPAKAGELSAIWTPSLIDCYLWYIAKLIQISGANGTFYDNAGLMFYANLDAGIGYQRPDGHVQPQSNLFVRREINQRLNTLGWLSGQPPQYWPNGSTFDLSFSQRQLLIEGEWYIWTRNGTLFDGTTPHYLCGIIAKGINTAIATSYEAAYPDGPAGTPHQSMRSVFALAVLHDFAASRLSWDRWQAAQTMRVLERIGFLDPEHQAEFLPYWDNADRVGFSAPSAAGPYQRIKPAHVFCSVYRQNGKAMLWLVNDSDEILAPDVWIDDTALIGKPAASLVDMETGEPLARLSPKPGDPIRNASWAHIYVPPKDYRALLLE